MSHTIRAVRSDHSLAEGENIIPDALYEMDYDVSALTAVDNLDGKKNLLTDALYEMGYGHNENLVNTLIARAVIDFDIAEYTGHVIDELIEHYGEEVLSGGLIMAVVREGLTTELRNAGGQSWRSLRWESLKKFVPYIIIDEIQSLGLSVKHGPALKESQNLSKHLSQVKRNLLINYGGELGYHLPDVDMVIYHYDTCRVLAVVSGRVTPNRIDQTIKLSQDEATKHIKIYFIGPDEDSMLSDNNSLENDGTIIETELDGSYILTEADTEDSGKAKLFEGFIADLKEAIDSDINRDALSDAS